MILTRKPVSTFRDHARVIDPPARSGQLLLHFVAEDLARGAARKILEPHEMHFLRPLVAGERFAAHGLDIGLAERIVAPRNEGDGNFAPFGVALAHYHGVAD